MHSLPGPFARRGGIGTTTRSVPADGSGTGVKPRSTSRRAPLRAPFANACFCFILTQSVSRSTNLSVIRSCRRRRHRNQDVDGLRRPIVARSSFHSSTTQEFTLQGRCARHQLDIQRSQCVDLARNKYQGPAPESVGDVACADPSFAGSSELQQSLFSQLPDICASGPSP